MNTNNRLVTFGQQLWNLLTQNWKSLIGFISAFIVGLFIPFWESKWIESPNLSMEITSISRIIDPGYGAELEVYPELKPLYEYKFIIRRAINEDVGGTIKFTPDELKKILEYAKRRRNEYPDQIDKYSKIVDQLNTNAAKNAGNIISTDIDYYYRPVREDPETTKKRAVEKLDQMKKNFEVLDRSMVSMENKVDEIINGITEKYSRFIIAVVITNSGKSSVSIKSPSLLRIYLGAENYTDLRLTVQDYKQNAEISSQGAKVITFESSLISDFPEEDRKSILAYWGQVAPSRIFLEDVFGKIYSSNSIPFSQGLYQKNIYDKLATEASKDIYQIKSK